MVASCLLLVLEGMLPFLSPQRWRATMLQAVQLNDRSLRLIGFGSMAVGVLLLSFIR